MADDDSILGDLEFRYFDDSKIGESPAEDFEQHEGYLTELIEQAIHNITGTMQPPRATDPEGSSERHLQYIDEVKSWCHDAVKEIAYALTGREWIPIGRDDDVEYPDRVDQIIGVLYDLKRENPDGPPGKIQRFVRRWAETEPVDAKPSSMTSPEGEYLWEKVLEEMGVDLEQAHFEVDREEMEKTDFDIRDEEGNRIYFRFHSREEYEEMDDDQEVEAGNYSRVGDETPQGSEGDSESDGKPSDDPGVGEEIMLMVGEINIIRTFHEGRSVEPRKMYQDIAVELVEKAIGIRETVKGTRDESEPPLVFREEYHPSVYWKVDVRDSRYDEERGKRQLIQSLLEVATRIDRSYIKRMGFERYDAYMEDESAMWRADLRSIMSTQRLQAYPYWATKVRKLAEMVASAWDMEMADALASSASRPKEEG